MSLRVKQWRKQNYTLINFLPTFHQERFRVKVEAFPSSPFSKPLQRSLIWTVSKFKSPTAKVCVVQFLQERQHGVVEEMLGQESKALASRPDFATYSVWDLGHLLMLLNLSLYKGK